MCTMKYYLTYYGSRHPFKIYRYMKAHGCNEIRFADVFRGFRAEFNAAHATATAFIELRRYGGDVWLEGPDENYCPRRVKIVSIPDSTIARDISAELNLIRGRTKLCFDSMIIPILSELGFELEEQSW